jgi:glycosyltransferase involved in cell wall biosynthesis
MNDVTVVIPIYNASGFLSETMASVWKQTQLPQEIILVDDKSKDDTLDVARVLASESPVPVRIVEMPSNSGGPAKPMNAGIDAAKTRFVAMLDHDDWLARTRLQDALEAIHHSKIDALVMGNYRLVCNGAPVHGSGSLDRFPKLEKALITSKDRYAFLAKEEWLVDFFTDSIQCSCSNHFFPKSLWKSVGGYREDIGLSSDFDFALRAFRDGVIWTNSDAFSKRVHQNNAWQASLENRNLAIRIRREYLKQACAPKMRPTIEKQFTSCLKKEIQWLRWNGHYRQSLAHSLPLCLSSPRFWIFREIALSVLGLIK